MKFLAQSDDYGITRGCAYGALYAIRKGVIRNTGLFSNMPWAEECVELIRPYLDKVALGLDLNASTGPSLLGYDLVPNLCHEDGSFLTSGENRALDTDDNNHDHVNYDQIYAEFEAQILRYIELVGHKPDYLHGHAYGTKTTRRASLDLARKYGILYSTQVSDRPEVLASGMGASWYIMPPTLENQAKSNLGDFIIDPANGYLDAEYVYLICHCGYVDAEILKLSSFNIFRARDLEGVTSGRVLDWVRKNRVELISYKDLPKEWLEEAIAKQ